MHYRSPSQRKFEILVPTEADCENEDHIDLEDDDGKEVEILVGDGNVGTPTNHVFNERQCPTPSVPVKIDIRFECQPHRFRRHCDMQECEAIG